MEKTWRWFGPSDPISLTQLRQIGVEGIVTALHHLPNGEIWSMEEIMVRKQAIEDAGMRWSVVESLPVSEGIKTHSPDWDRLVFSYQESLKNLASCGITCVCYNFMPVLDWVRTNLAFPIKEGLTMAFDPITFAAFDVFILRRPKAERDHTESILAAAEQRYGEMNEDEREALAYSLIVHTQAFIDGAVGKEEKHYKEKFLDFLASYQDLDRSTLRKHLIAFLKEIIPLAESYGVQMAIHPDDPPFPVLGLPRIVSTQADLQAILGAVPSRSNGLTLCTGSLAARKDNDVLAILKKHVDRIHFAHLRNVDYWEGGVFYESGHLEGVVDMPEVVYQLLREEQRRKNKGWEDARIPMRPDHGIATEEDKQWETPPGYSFLGRMRGLAELVGLERGVLHSFSNY